jgi:orotidine-5'-phosphate decarboxylase
LRHPADALLEAVGRVGSPVCVGLDPVLDRLPATLKSKASHEGGPIAAIETFSRDVLRSVAPHVPCVKFQSACFERYRGAGIDALDRLMKEARELGLIVVLDVKRGDIGVSAEHYAAAGSGADWVTVNPYLGADGILPFLTAGLGVFALVRTSNPSGDELQEAPLADGATVAEHVASQLAALGAATIGDRGYSALGAVVGATKRDSIRRLRQRMPHQMLLVPGLGAQGGAIDDVLDCFDAEGGGAVITASRSIIYAFDADDPGWAAAVGHAAQQLAGQLQAAVSRHAGSAG